MEQPPFETIRPLLVSVDGVDTVRVALEHRAELFVADCRVADGKEESRAAAGAAATAAALTQFTPDAVTLELQWCALVDTAPGLPRVVATMIGVDVVGVRMRYAGAAVMGAGDPAEVGAKAVLASLNRRLGVTGL